MRLENLAVSPCSNPELPLDEALEAYAAMGYRKFEVFTGWVKSAYDIQTDPAAYKARADRRGMRLKSMHLPPVTNDIAGSLDLAVLAARQAKALGVDVVLFKAMSRPLYIESARRFLDAVEPLGITAVLQNHAGSPLSSLDDVREAHEGIADSRMRALLEVGHFHSAGVGWREAAEYLGDKIALVHIKDQVGRQSVPFGSGEIDLGALIGYLDAAGYAGDYVVEMEVADRENTLRYLAEARTYLRQFCRD